MFLVILLFLPMIASAQSLRDRFDAGIEITPSEWQQLTSGRTVIYQNYGVVHGREYYPADSNEVFYEFADGTCLEGTVTYEPSQFCFDWQGHEFMCFQHKYIDGEIFIAGSGGVTFVSDIVDDPFRCTPGLMSTLDLPLSLASLK